MKYHVLFICVGLSLSEAGYGSSDEPPPFWSGEGSISYVQAGGNASSSTIGSGIVTALERNIWRHELRANYIRSKADGRKNTERLSASGRMVRGVSGDFSVYTQISYLRDIFAGVHRQNIVDGGVLAKVVAHEHQQLTLGTALIWSDEKKTSFAGPRKFWGSRTGFAWRYSASGAVQLRQETDYLHDFSNPANWQIVSTSAASVAAGKIFALKLSYQAYHRNRPDIQILHKTDTTFLVSLVARWPVQSK